MHSSRDVHRHVRRYLQVFLALLILTGATVVVAELNVSVRIGLVVALSIAALKGMLVAAVFMHLDHERPMVYGLVVLTVVVAFGLLVLPALGHVDRARF